MRDLTVFGQIILARRDFSTRLWSGNLKMPRAQFLHSREPVFVRRPFRSASGAPQFMCERRNIGMPEWA
jgi:hypothetical protein